MARAAFLALVALVSGFLVWSSAFIALYGLHGGACATDWAADRPQMLTAALQLTGFLHVGACVFLSVEALTWWRRAPATATGLRFVRQLTLGLSFVAVVSTLWLMAPTLMLRVC